MNGATPAARQCGGVSDQSAVGRASTLRLHYPDDLRAFIPECDWEYYGRVIRIAEERGLRFAMSGGFTASFYTGFWRNTKDMDLCVVPSDRDAMVQVTRDAGLHDLYGEQPYDRGWIYRSTHEGVIVDIIWQLANYRGEVDEAWLACGPEITLYGQTVRLVPVEEMIWSKIHIVQRDRCDFPDIVNMMYSAGADLDWARLLDRLPGEERLLASVVALFSWLAPGCARRFPEWIWERMGMQRPAEGPDRDEDRIRRLDSRPWFTPATSA